MTNKETKDKKVWHICDLNCFQIHAVEVAKQGGKLECGTAVGPDGNRYSHTWVKKEDKIIDLFNWTDHKPEFECNLPSKSELKQLINHLKKYKE